MDITKIQSAGYNITFIAQPGETGPRVLVDLRSPFSREATAAIKASFTAAQWETIRAWGFAHPEIVPYVNQDPMIVMSIISGLGERYFYGNVAFAQSATQGAVTTHMNVFKLELDAEIISLVASSTNWPTILALHGYTNSTNTGPYWQIQATGNTTSFRVMVGSEILNNSVSIPKNVKKTYGFEQSSDSTKSVWISDSKWSRSGNNTADNAILISNISYVSKIYEARLTMDGVNYRFVPMKQGNDVVLQDINGSGMKLVQQTGSSGTMVETPAS